MTRVLVTAASHPTGRNCIRALLDQENVEVIATDSREAALARLPFDVRRATLPPPESPEFISAIADFCVKHGIEVILPGLDSITLLLARHKVLLAQSGVFAPVPDYNVAVRATDKFSLMHLAEAASVPHAKTVCLRSEADIGCLASLRYPIIAKPRVGHGARGVLMYESPPSDWSKLIRAIKKHEMLAQEYIPGEAGSIYVCGLLYDQRHDLKFAFQSKSIKTEFNFGGPAMCGVSVQEPVIRAYSEKLVREAGPWVGIALLEFKRHSETGEFNVMDFNPRIWGYSSLADDAGVSFPFASVLVAHNRGFRSHDDYLVGVHMERQQLLDQSTYTFACGKRIDISRPGEYRTANRRVVVLIKDGSGMEHLASALDDSEIDAVLVLGRPNRERVQRCAIHEKLYFWDPPTCISHEDLGYWAGYLLRATDVQIVEDGVAQLHAWHDLRRSWWFGYESRMTPFVAAPTVTREAA